jgi:hypothetical protein
MNRIALDRVNGYRLEAYAALLCYGRAMTPSHEGAISDLCIQQMETSAKPVG